MANDIQLKRCAACHDEGPIEAFGLDKSRISGRLIYCKVCANAKRRLWTARNRERDNANQRSGYWRNHQRELATAAKWRDENREKIRAYFRVRAKAFPHQHADQARKRRAIRAGVFVEPVNSLVVLRLGHGLCGICGERVEGRFDVDHIIPLSRGGEHSYANTQPAHPFCNGRKGARIA